LVNKNLGSGLKCNLWHSGFVIISGTGAESESEKVTPATFRLDCGYHRSKWYFPCFSLKK